METTLFPFDEVRDIQQQFIEHVEEALKESKSLVAHAPTGLGKTAGALAPALEYALKHKKTIFFLTSRHTQHRIAIDTLKAIKNKHGTSFQCTDLIGKKHMCLVPGVQNLHSGEFFDYCRRVREENACEFYTNTKEQNRLTVEAKALLDDLKRSSPHHVHEVRQEAHRCKMCPYEIGIELGRKAHVIIADYYYAFNPTILNSFLAKTGKQIEDCIIIVDEGHNLPGRIRELMTHRLTLNMLDRAIREASKHQFPGLADKLTRLRIIIKKLSDNLLGEKKLTKEAIKTELEKYTNYTQLIVDLVVAADHVRLSAKVSFMGSIATFLEAWKEADEGFVRYMQAEQGPKEKKVTVFYKCLDPSLLTKDIIAQSHSTILMSGTLTPVDMYADLLGFDERTLQHSYASPFPPENRLSLVVPKTSTRYAARSEEQFKNIASIVAEVINNVPGNSAIFFPSYKLRDAVYRHLSPLLTKTTFMEASKMSSEERNDLLERFKSYHKTGAALLGVAAGSFGEGIDLPGDLLKAVVVVGVPLKQPNIEAKALIEYYDAQFGRGWDYGYTFPSLNHVMQAAGRCIRSQTDKGVIVFLDERYAWNNYLRCFPRDWDVKITALYNDRIEEFFEQ